MTIHPRLTAGAWIAAGAGWLAASLAGAAADDGSTRFYIAEAIWLPTQALLLAGIIGLAQQRPHGTRRLGKAGFGTAAAGRVVFIAAELVSITTGETADTILPIGALLTAIGMTMAGAAVIREHRWHGWRRFTPLTMGLYPVVFMFPLAATNAPVEPSIALWALPTIAVGIATLSSQPTTSSTTATQARLGETVRGGRGH
ncbi:hypothetical protein ACTMTJ_37460 [Phytohabitans sp. LJ34]|uniref:hypothetical protein n=1 Tax=Phytohabitans sp. LJ34 TaxID=3452217 RepID=UPI003F8B983C